MVLAALLELQSYTFRYVIPVRNVLSRQARQQLSRRARNNGPFATHDRWVHQDPQQCCFGLVPAAAAYGCWRLLENSASPRAPAAEVRRWGRPKLAHFSTLAQTVAKTVLHAQTEQPVWHLCPGELPESPQFLIQLALEHCALILEPFG